MNTDHEGFKKLFIYLRGSGSERMQKMLSRA